MKRRSTSSTWALSSCRRPAKLSEGVSANLGETKDVFEEEATCASLLESPPLGNDMQDGSTTKKGVGEEAGKSYGENSFLPKITSQDCFRQG